MGDTRVISIGLFLAIFGLLLFDGCQSSPTDEPSERHPGGSSGEVFPITIHYGLNDSHSNHWVQLSAAGVVGIVYGKGIVVGDIGQTGDLIYHTIQADGSEREEVVTRGSGVNKSVLLYDAGSKPHLFYARSDDSDQFIYHFFKNHLGDWLSETVINFAGEGGKYIYEISADIGRDDAIHLLVLKSRSNPDSPDYNWAFLDSNLYHITNRSGTWEKHWIKNYDTFYTYDVDTKTLRRQDMAVDDDGHVHVVFGEQIDVLGDDSCATGRLHYATNKTGEWVIELALEPITHPHEAGWSPSLCLDHRGRPAVASTYVARVLTLSMSDAHLAYSVRQDDGTWHTTVVADEADGYLGTDGGKYTGALPHLKFDRQNRPHIVFSDIASSHGPYNYINIGQIRYAAFNGRSWDLTTVYRQPSPQAFYTASEMGGQCLVISEDGERIQVVGQELITTSKGVYTYQLVHFVIK